MHRRYQFDQVFGANVPNETIFIQQLLPDIKQFLLGTNTTIIGFGALQTGKMAYLIKI